MRHKLTFFFVLVTLTLCIIVYRNDVYRSILQGGLSALSYNGKKQNNTIKTEDNRADYFLRKHDFPKKYLGSLYGQRLILSASVDQQPDKILKRITGHRFGINPLFDLVDRYRQDPVGGIIIYRDFFYETSNVAEARKKIDLLRDANTVYAIFDGKVLKIAPIIGMDFWPNLWCDITSQLHKGIPASKENQLKIFSALGINTIFGPMIEIDGLPSTTIENLSNWIEYFNEAGIKCFPKHFGRICTDCNPHFTECQHSFTAKDLQCHNQRFDSLFKSSNSINSLMISHNVVNNIDSTSSLGFSSKMIESLGLFKRNNKLYTVSDALNMKGIVVNNKLRLSAVAKVKAIQTDFILYPFYFNPSELIKGIESNKYLHFLRNVIQYKIDVGLITFANPNEKVSNSEIFVLDDLLGDTKIRMAYNPGVNDSCKILF